MYIQDCNEALDELTYFSVLYQEYESETETEKFGASFETGCSTDIQNLKEDLHYCISLARKESEEHGTLISVKAVISTEKGDEVIDVEYIDDYEITFKGGVEI